MIRMTCLNFRRCGWRPPPATGSPVLLFRSCFHHRLTSATVGSKKSPRPPAAFVTMVVHRHFASPSSSSGTKRIYFTWKSFVISGILISIFATYMLQLKNEKLRHMERQRKKALGETAIGGRFDLVDQNGKRFTSADLDGKWALIYFGFTHCPDVCPDELEKIVEAVELISRTKGADPIQPVFITVDPERDDVAAVRDYIREFSPKFIGLTGTKDQVDQATRAYRVYYSAGPRDHENDYIVDHTIITYLINPEGQLVDYYGQTKTAQDMANGVVSAMEKYRNENRRLGFL